MKGPCIYCDAGVECETEHVFPASWYPASTPDTVQHLTVPSCPACNDRWEKVERQVGHDLLFVTSPRLPGIEGVHARITRAWQASTGKTPKERRIRAGVARQMLRTMQWLEPAPGGPQATIRTPGGLLVRASPARRFEPATLGALSEKFIRGLHYTTTGEILSAVRVHRAFIATDERFGDPELAELWEALQTLPIDDSLGPGFAHRRYVHDDGRSLWAFWIWRQVTIVAIVELAR